MADVTLAKTEFTNQCTVELKADRFKFGDSKYTVVYGEQVTTHYDKYEAMDEYKNCVNHALECQLFEVS